MGHFTSVKHLIMPPCCGLDLRCDHAHLGFDQRQLWTIIKKKIDSCAKNALYRHLKVVAGTGFVKIGNHNRCQGDRRKWIPSWPSWKRLSPYFTRCLRFSNGHFPMRQASIGGSIMKRKPSCRHCGDGLSCQASVPLSTTREFSLTSHNKILTF